MSNHEDGTVDERPVTQAQKKTIVDTLRSLKKKINTSSEKTVDLAVRHIKKEDGYQFKKRGHCMQYEFNEDVKAKVEEAESVLKKIPVAEGVKASLDNTNELLQQGMSLFGKRQKHKDDVSVRARLCSGARVRGRWLSQQQ